MFELWSKNTETRKKQQFFTGISKKRWEKGGEKTEKTGNDSSSADNKRTV
jgi:hypothetical protein